METLAQSKSFLNRADAISYLDYTIFDWESSGWQVMSSTLRYVNLQWQVYVEFRKAPYG